MPTMHVEVIGRVQGVGFRYFVQERAQELGLAGWVRNLRNGHVELAASGSGEALGRLLDAVRRGPPASRVAEVRTLPPPADATLPDPFTILRTPPSSPESP